MSSAREATWHAGLRILPPGHSQQVIQAAIAPGQPMRILEKALGCHSKKFVGPLCGIVIEGDNPIVFDCPLKPFTAFLHRSRPLTTVTLQWWHTVDFTIEHVDEMRAFMDHDTSAASVS